MSPRWGKGFDVHQLQLNWHTPQCQNQQLQSPADDTGTTLAGKPLLRLRWDFRTRFPQPTDDAINEGFLQPENTEPENLAALHSAHANRMLATLSDIDALADAARLGVDPTTGKPPAGDVGLQRLEAARHTEPGRLKRWYESLLGAYRDWFGNEAANAFDKAVRAWHARVEVVVENGLAATNPALPSDPPHRQPVSVVVEPAELPDAGAPALSALIAEDSTVPMLPAPRESVVNETIGVIARLPVPRPLPEAVATGDFGRGDDGRPINPSPAEVREITVSHAEALVDLIVQAQRADSNQRQRFKEQYLSGIAAYSSSFGERAAAQLDAYVRRQARSLHITPVWRSPQSEVQR